MLVPSGGRGRGAPAYDAIIIGSGFGGSMVAHELVRAGYRVLMLERGSRVPRGPHNWNPKNTIELSRFYSLESSYRLAGSRRHIGSIWAVGGPSVFYGGVALRLRERDFESDPAIVGDSEARWPYSYNDLEPYYARAEAILHVAGEAGGDPIEPPRSSSYPGRLGGLSPASRMLSAAARDLSLRPFRLPLAINYGNDGRRSGCIACGTCDTFACAIEAKNDVATVVLRGLMNLGLELRENTVVRGLVEIGGRITAVECCDRRTGRRYRETARFYVLSAGALGSPHLLLASDLPRLNPGGYTVGHYLMRHCSAIAFGYFHNLPEGWMQFHKQVGIHDLYFGHTTVRSPIGKLGSIQQVQTPPVALVMSELGWPLGRLVRPRVSHAMGLLALAEDQPSYQNYVKISHKHRDAFGLPQLVVRYRHSPRDRRARRTLVATARRILRRAGALFCYVHEIHTFSHAVGTVRMGVNPLKSALDEYCRFRGVENLLVVDGSFMPTSAGVNPSLTIAANALRAGEKAIQALAAHE